MSKGVPPQSKQFTALELLQSCTFRCTNPFSKSSDFTTYSAIITTYIAEGTIIYNFSNLRLLQKLHLWLQNGHFLGKEMFLGFAKIYKKCWKQIKTAWITHSNGKKIGAVEPIWTADLILTKEILFVFKRIQSFVFQVFLPKF